MEVTKVTISAAEGVSTFGNPEPRVELSVEETTSWRDVNTILYAVASELEYQSDDDDPWCVVVDKDHQNVHLELVYEEHEKLEVVKKAMSFLNSAIDNLGEVTRFTRPPTKSTVTCLPAEESR